MLQVQSVLIVDDDPNLQTTIRAVLEEGGYEVAQAGNGREALDLLEDLARPSLIVLDLQMPIMDGRELLGRLRVHEILKKIPVLVMSSLPLDAGTLGAPFLRKPFDPDTLLLSVRTYSANMG
jgi:CheY-like chemotaxis protein